VRICEYQVPGIGPSSVSYDDIIILVHHNCEFSLGRSRIENNSEAGDRYQRNVEAIIQNVRERGIFKTRKLEEIH
jgi:hypothetical protein